MQDQTGKMHSLFCINTCTILNEYMNKDFGLLVDCKVSSRTRYFESTSMCSFFMFSYQDSRLHLPKITHKPKILNRFSVKSLQFDRNKRVAYPNNTFLNNDPVTI